MSGFLPGFRQHDPNENTKVIKEEHVGTSILPGIGTSGVAAALDFIKDPNAINDRKFLLEEVLTKLSEFPAGSVEKRLEQITVGLLYNDLPHPPLSKVGDKYAWRSADGSNNNIESPDIGKAGDPYARSVAQATPLPPHLLPDPELVFDTLLRRDKFKRHPAGLSSLMFSFAALVIHSVFRTRLEDPSINDTSSYVDLAPLYGANQGEQDQVRVHDGRGLLLPDMFAEKRLLLLPHPVSVLLILFNRNHNYIAKKLLDINERGTWKDPDTIPRNETGRGGIIAKQDNEIFQTARLINCGWFGFVVFSDYFSAILGLVRQGNSWNLDPFSEFRREDHAIFERGRGNVCSVEFNCLYRWHATTSKADEEWVNKLMAKSWPGKEPDQVDVKMFKDKMKQEREQEADLATRIFNEFKRTNGKCDDAELAKILKDHTDAPAASFGARGTPSNMKSIEIMGIESARNWGCCSLNDFRQFLGLRRYESFLEWNPDKKVAAAAEKLYGNIDRLELYTGLQAEATKPVIKGAGLCPGYTISRAILADAIALIRGDRFFTADFTAHNLTAWGLADCTKSPDNPGFGSMLGRLFQRTLPNEFTDNSIYAWFPLMTPEAMKEILTKVGGMEEYDFVRPGSSSSILEFKEYGQVSGILGNKEKFRHPFLSRISTVIHGPGFFLATSSPERGERERGQMLNTLAESPEQIKAIANFFYQRTKALIAKESYELVGGKHSALDIVRDVFRVVPIQWVATQVAGMTLKKSQSDIGGTFTETELFSALSDIYAFCFLNIESGQVLKTKRRVETEIQQIMDHVEANVGGSIFKRLYVNGLVDTISRSWSRKHDLASKLQQTGAPTSQIANWVLAVMVGASVELAQALTLALNVLIDKPKVARDFIAADKAEIVEGYVSELLRIDPPVQDIFRRAGRSEVVGSTSIKDGNLVYLDITTANKNARAFPEPPEINPSRPRKDYIRGDILTGTLGTELVSRIIHESLRAVFELKDVKRVLGQSGHLKQFVTEVEGVKLRRYLDENQQLCPWARSMVIKYEN